MVKTFAAELFFLDCLQLIPCKKYGFGCLVLDFVAEEWII